MAEITRDDNCESAGHKQPISAERYSLMAGILASRFPDKAPELFAYMATIIREFSGGGI